MKSYSKIVMLRTLFAIGRREKNLCSVGRVVARDCVEDEGREEKEEERGFPLHSLLPLKK